MTEATGDMPSEEYIKQQKDRQGLTGDEPEGRNSSRSHRRRDRREDHNDRREDDNNRRESYNDRREDYHDRREDYHDRREDQDRRGRHEDPGERSKRSYPESSRSDRREGQDWRERYSDSRRDRSRQGHRERSRSPDRRRYDYRYSRNAAIRGDRRSRDRRESWERGHHRAEPVDDRWCPDGTHHNQSWYSESYQGWYSNGASRGADEEPEEGEIVPEKKEAQVQVEPQAEAWYGTEGHHAYYQNGYYDNNGYYWNGEGSNEMAAGATQTWNYGQYPAETAQPAEAAPEGEKKEVPKEKPPDLITVPSGVVQVAPKEGDAAEGGAGAKRPTFVLAKNKPMLQVKIKPGSENAKSAKRPKKEDSFGMGAAYLKELRKYEAASGTESGHSRPLLK